MKQARFLLTVVIGLVLLCGLCVAADEATQTITGVVEEVADDGTYVIVSGTRIETSPELADEAYFENGDSVKITATSSGTSLTAVDYEYIYEDEEGDVEVEEGTVDVE